MNPTCFDVAYLADVNIPNIADEADQRQDDRRFITNEDDIS